MCTNGCLNTPRFEFHARAYYQRKREEGKHYNAAAVCVARCRSVTSC